MDTINSRMTDILTMMERMKRNISNTLDKGSDISSAMTDVSGITSTVDTLVTRAEDILNSEEEH